MCHLILFLPVLAIPVFWIFPFNLALGIYSFILGISLLIYFKIFQAMRQRVRTGPEGMLGQIGIVIQDIDPVGKIKYTTEIWDAVTDGKRFVKGDKVKISRFLGMKLLVEEAPVGKSP